MNAAKWDAVVIGAGPGGYPCAIRMAQRGLKVAIVEKGNLGGVCLNVGCIPSKALIHASSLYSEMLEAEAMGFSLKGIDIDHKKLQDWKSNIVKKLTQGVSQLLTANKVTQLSGEAKFVSNTEIEIDGKDGLQRIKAKNFVIAIGSSPIALKDIPFDEENILSSTGALDIDTNIKSLAVIGGGYIGLEIGTFLAKLGTEVSIIEAEDSFLPTYDKDISNVVLRSLKKRGVKVLTGTMAKSIKKGAKGQELLLQTKDGEEKLSCEKVLVTVGRKPNTMAGLEKAGVKIDKGNFIPVDKQLRSNVPNIFCIGDVAGQPMLAHKASKEALVAADIIAGKNISYDVRAMPAVIFCEPELATVGLSEAEAKKEGIEVSVGSFPFAALGKSIATNATEGMVKLIGEKKSGLLIGAAIVGRESSAMIAECALAIEAGLSLEDIALTVHAHPTIGEATMEAAEVALGMPIHIVSKRPQ